MLLHPRLHARTPRRPNSIPYPCPRTHPHFLPLPLRMEPQCFEVTGVQTFSAMRWEIGREKTRRDPYCQQKEGGTRVVCSAQTKACLAKHHLEWLARHGFDTTTKAPWYSIRCFAQSCPLHVLLLPTTSRHRPATSQHFLRSLTAYVDSHSPPLPIGWDGRHARPNSGKKGKYQDPVGASKATTLGTCAEVLPTPRASLTRA